MSRVSIAQAADFYGVSTQTIRRRIASGEITAYRFGPRLIRVDTDEIDAKVFHEVPTVGTRPVYDLGPNGD